jgi:hypothetical protein
LIKTRVYNVAATVKRHGETESGARVKQGDTRRTATASAGPPNKPTTNRVGLQFPQVPIAARNKPMGPPLGAHFSATAFSVWRHATSKRSFNTITSSFWSQRFS